MRATPRTVSDAELAAARERGDEVYVPGHDCVFEPWPAESVRQAVRRVCEIARAASSKEEAARAGREELPEFASKYQTTFDRFSDPALARDPDKVELMMKLIDIRAEMERGLQAEEGFKRAAAFVLGRAQGQ